MSAHPWVNRTRSVVAAPVFIVIAGLVLTALITAGVSWRLERASSDAIQSGEALLESWSTQLTLQLDTERMEWASVLAVLMRQRSDAVTASAQLTAAQHAGGGPLQSKLFLLDEQGQVVASSVPEAMGYWLNVPHLNLSGTPSLLTLEPTTLPWTQEVQYLAVAQVLPVQLGVARTAVHFLPVSRLRAIAAAAFQGRTARFELLDPVLHDRLIVTSRGAGFLPGTSVESGLRPDIVWTSPNVGLKADPQSPTVEASHFSVASGDDWLSRTTPLPGLGSTLVVSYSKNEVLAYVNSSARPSTIALAVVLGGLVWSVLLVTARGVYQAQRARRHLERLVGIDPLTQLPNRRAFNDYLRVRLDGEGEPERLGILFVDMDNFKDVNDTYGHDAGDDLLCKIARLLGGAVRAEDRVFRIGGDEFTVVLPGAASHHEVELVAKRVLDALSGAVEIRGNSVYVSASVGAALAPVDADSSSQLVRCADLAVYAAKDRGRSCYAVYDVALKAKAEARATIAAEVYAGLGAGEFHLHYQPKVDLQSGVVSGYEALLRWAHPTRGAVAPCEYISIAEESSLIHELGAFVIDRAVRQIAEWHQEGKGYKAVAVNVSTAQLRDVRAVDQIEQALAKYGVPGHCLQVEVTETMLAADIELAVWLISRLKQMGVQVAVDDFGTGYSSLAALQKFNVDFLKIDRSFVQDICEDRGSLEICKAVIELAHALQVRVIAEGVESFGQYVMLLELGCDEAQGFMFSRARPPEDAVNWQADIALFRPISDLRLAA